VRSRLRIFLGAFGDPGHAFPMLALGTRLVARGHDVAFETWERWQAHVEAEGMAFVAAPDYPVFPTRDRPLNPYEGVVPATAGTREALVRCRPDVVVHDILTLAPAMAAELEGVPVATLIPHFHPFSPPGYPPYAFGARPPRTAFGRRFWRAMERPLQTALRQGRDELNATRAQLGLPRLSRLHGGISPQLCIVGTFPQLEYPRNWGSEEHVVGPLIWEPPFADVDPPPGDDPLVLIAPSTAQDPAHTLLRTTLLGLARERVRVLAATNRKPIAKPVTVPDNARLVEWISYSRSMPRADLVVTHAGHGTLARALESGCPVLAVPHSGDMGENAARIDWAGVGVRLPWRLLTPGTLRLAARRALSDGSLRVRARALSDWAARHDGAARAAELVERLALSRRGASGRTR